MKPVSLAIAGAGNRGEVYARYALLHPDRARVVAVAEPRAEHRMALAAAHSIPEDRIFLDWRDLAAQEPLAQAVVIATQDGDHRGPAEAFAAKGYAMLLEKPMAPTAADCRAIVEAVEKAGILFAVGHVLRYTPYTRRLKAFVDDGRLGEIVAVQRLEPVGFFHHAHSYVRGNWRRSADSSSMLLAKSCHDLDWIRHIVGNPCEALCSFGSLKTFRPEERPEGAGDRCLDCAIEERCPYSAKRIYLGRVARGETEWPVNILTRDPTEEKVTEALRLGPYGRCVWACDNDVVDHQEVSLRFEGGATASFTMSAFTHFGGRRTRVMGTRGEIFGDGTTLEHYDFLTDRRQRIEAASVTGGLSGHGGGDEGLMAAFVEAVATENADLILSGPRESLETHLMVFAAEQSRHEERVVRMELGE